MKKIRRKNKGFTLAEVLMTLSIIGVVAAMTMPALISSTNKAELKAGLNTAYSTVSQAVLYMNAEEGGGLWVKYSSNTNSFKPQFMKYFKTAKDCNWHECVADDHISDVYLTFSKTKGIFAHLLDDGQFIINNGMTVFIENYESTSGIFISVDVNGYKKKPNVWGQDLFTFELMKDGSLKPAGAPGTGVLGYFGTGFENEPETYCSSSSDHVWNGIGCTAKALSDSGYWDNLP